MMNEAPSRWLAALVCCLAGIAYGPELLGQEAQRQAYYYSGERRITGTLDTSILAVAIPQSSSVSDFRELVDSIGAEPLSEDIPYVQEFQQEGVVFLRLPQPVDLAGFLQLSSSFRRIAPAVRAGHPFFVEGEDLPLIVTNELVVRFNAEMSEDDISDYNRTQNVQVVSESPHVGNQYVLRVTAASGANAMEMANRYTESGLVEFAQPNFLVHVQFEYIPADTDFSDQWHLLNTGSGAMTADADIDVTEAWDITLGDPNIVIAVLDGGNEPNHPDLDDNVLVNAIEQAGSPGVDDDGNGYVDDVGGWSFVGNSDDVSVGLWTYHGQAVAGLAAAEENGTGVVGVCPRCQLLLIAIDFAISELADAFYYARDRGADIITNSWGHTGTVFEQPALITAIDETANGTRGGLGISIFFATGNDGGGTVAYPARDPNTIAIGGSDCTDVRYNSSQFGPEIDVLAPTRQDDGTCGLVTTGLGNTTTHAFGGTSGATPIAAGTAGLLLAVNPYLTRLHVRRILRESADRIEPATANYNADGFSLTHGYGRVNAHRALQLATRTPVRRALSLHAGIAVPFGTLDNTTDLGPTVNLDFVFPIADRLAGDIRLGYSLFTGSGAASDVDMWNLSANLKYYANLGTPWLFLNGGIGLYLVDGNDVEGGGNLGAGIGFAIGQQLDFEATVNLHSALTASPEVTFGKLQIGLIRAL